MNKYIVAAVSALLIFFVAIAIATAAEVSFTNRIMPMSVIASENVGEAYKLLDNNGATAWIFSRTIRPATLKFAFDRQNIQGVWIRSGDYSNEAQYRFYDRALFANVLVTTAQGRTEEYIFNIAERYDASTNNSTWKNGYQLFSFGNVINDVVSVDMTLLSFEEGTGRSGKLAVSDAAFTSTASITSNVTRVYDDTPQAPSAGSEILGLTPGRTDQVVTLLKRLATRSGPSTNYDEDLGSFFKGGESIRVINKAWDHRNDRYWVQVEFTDERGRFLRAYTGIQRVNITQDQLPTESVLYEGRYTSGTAKAYTGPGTQYFAYRFTVPGGTYCDVIMIENGYALIEFAGGPKDYRRVWVEASVVE